MTSPIRALGYRRLQPNSPYLHISRLDFSYLLHLTLTILSKPLHSVILFCFILLPQLRTSN
jgi:hypothetical protein